MEAWVPNLNKMERRESKISERERDRITSRDQGVGVQNAEEMNPRGTIAKEPINHNMYNIIMARLGFSTCATFCRRK